MSEFSRLATLVRELEDQLVVCMRCGFCQAVCPLFDQTHLESDVARGKLALLDGLAQDILRDPAGVKKRLERCLLCGSCAANCPSGVKVLDIFLKARMLLTGYMGISPAKRLLLRGLLARPQFFDRLMAWAPKLQGLLAKPADDLLGTSCARLPITPLAQRHFKRLADKPLHRIIPSKNTAKGASGLRIGFFVGCLIDKLFPQVGSAALAILDHHQVGVFMPAAQACCGLPALSAGESKSFQKLLMHNLERFDPDNFDYLVTACATCTATIKHMWPLMAVGMKPAQRKRLEALCAKTRDLSQFLVGNNLVPKKPGDHTGKVERVTYHDPCHLKKSLGVAAEPRRLLEASPGIRLQEMVDSDWCCGMGGSFNLAYYDISRGIGQRKIDNIQGSGASVVATSCPACMLQISDLLSQSGASIKVVHVAEIYAQSILGK